MQIEIRCIVACKNASGCPDFFPVVVKCTKDQYDNGDHYDAAKAYGLDNDYEEPMVAFDEKDKARLGSMNLFDAVDWKSVDRV